MLLIIDWDSIEDIQQRMLYRIFSANLTFPLATWCTISIVQNIWLRLLGRETNAF